MLIYTLPFIAALTGYITNYIAVKMLFHPRKPVNLGIFALQGIFPKRQDKLAEKLGQIVAKELFNANDVVKALEDPNTQQEAKAVVEAKVDAFINEKLPEKMPMLQMFLNDTIKATIKDTLMTEFDNMLPELVQSLSDKIKNGLNVEKVVQDKVKAFSSDKLEEILFSIMRKEFRFIELLGGLLGFIIGLIQLALVTLS